MSKADFAPVRYRVTWFGKSVTGADTQWPMVYLSRRETTDDVARFLRQTTGFTRWDKCVVEGPTGKVVIKRKKDGATIHKKEGDCKGLYKPLNSCVERSLYKPLADVVAAAGVNIK